MRLNRRRLGGGLLIAAGITAFIIPFLFMTPTQNVAPPPPPPTGSNSHSGSGGNGGTSPPCTTNCSGSGTKDTQPPTTTIQITSPLTWSRGSVQYDYPNFTITLHATDDGNLTNIVLNDNTTTASFPVHGKTSNATITIKTTGLHMLSYYSIDQAGNKETPHPAIAGLAKPNLSDLQNIIDNSRVDNAGIKNALDAKVREAQDQLARNQPPNALNALSNQLNAVAGKHGLDQTTVSLLQSMITAITGTQGTAANTASGQTSNSTLAPTASLATLLAATAWTIATFASILGTTGVALAVARLQQPA